MAQAIEGQPADAPELLSADALTVELTQAEATFKASATPRDKRWMARVTADWNPEGNEPWEQQLRRVRRRLYWVAYRFFSKGGGAALDGWAGVVPVLPRHNGLADGEPVEENDFATHLLDTAFTEALKRCQEGGFTDDKVIAYAREAVRGEQVYQLRTGGHIPHRDQTDFAKAFKSFALGGRKLRAVFADHRLPYTLRGLQRASEILGIPVTPEDIARKADRDPFGADQWVARGLRVWESRNLLPRQAVTRRARSAGAAERASGSEPDDLTPDAVAAPDSLARDGAALPDGFAYSPITRAYDAAGFSVLAALEAVADWSARPERDRRLLGLYKRDTEKRVMAAELGVSPARVSQLLHEIEVRVTLHMAQQLVTSKEPLRGPLAEHLDALRATQRIAKPLRREATRLAAVIRERQSAWLGTALAEAPAGALLDAVTECSERLTVAAALADETGAPDAGWAETGWVLGAVRQLAEAAVEEPARVPVDRKQSDSQIGPEASDAYFVPRAESEPNLWDWREALDPEARAREKAERRARNREYERRLMAGK